MQFDPQIDYYAALGVSNEATPEEIKKAYRRLAKKFHPDSTGGDKAKEAKFKEISSAYDVLGDREKREQYDAFRAAPRMPPGFAAGGGQGFDFGNLDLGDLFSQVFGGRGAPGGVGGPGNVEYRFYSSDPGSMGDPFAGAPGGQTRRRRRRRRQAEPPAPPTERKRRASDGSALVQRGDNLYSDVRVRLDQAILGAVVEVPTLSGKAHVKIPPGTSSGAKLRLKGKGARSAQGYGDHYVTVHIDVPKKIDEKAETLLAEFMKRTRGTK